MVLMYKQIHLHETSSVFKNKRAFQLGGACRPPRPPLLSERIGPPMPTHSLEEGGGVEKYIHGWCWCRKKYNDMSGIYKYLHIYA